MVLQECSIEFHSPHSIYYAGQSVTGRFTFTLTKPKRVRGVTLTFKGIANTEWTEQETVTIDGKQENQTTHYSATEHYFSMEYYVLGGSTGELVIDAGIQSFTFNCKLPLTLPSSYEGKYGNIRYSVLATLRRPWKFDQEIKKLFTVLSPLDLNSFPNLTDRVRLARDKFFCCLCCRNGPLSCLVNLNCGGFVSGQSFPIYCQVDNVSKVDVEKVTYGLRSITTFVSNHPRREMKKDTNIIIEFDVGSVPARSSRIFDQPFTIPPLPPSKLNFCNIINLDYELFVKLVVSGLHSNLSIEVPIVIGTVPLASSTIGWETSQSGSSQPAPSVPYDSTPSAPSMDIVVDTQPRATRDRSMIAPVHGLVPYDRHLIPGTTEAPMYSPYHFGTQSVVEKGDSSYMMYLNDEKAFAPMYPVYHSQNN